MQAVAILCILVTWAGYAAIVTGLGAWHFLLIRKEKCTFSTFVDAFWCGLVTLLALLQFWHFLAPINFIAHFTLTTLGLFSFLFFAPILWRKIRQLPRRPLLYSIAAMALITIWLANRATGPNAEYDAGLYHIAAVKWTKLYRIIPGLANLHMRFGFSSTITLFSALMDQGIWTGNASHFVNGFFLAALAAMIVRSAARILTMPTADAADWLLIFTTPLLTDWALDVQASSYSTDIGAAVLTIVAAYYFLRAFADRVFFLSVLLAAAAISVKASTLFLCGPLILFAILLQKRRRFLSILAIAALIIPWLARQTILSGYPFYPAEYLPFPVDWKVPFIKVQWLHSIILNWARWQSYDDTSHHLRWVDPWVHLRLLPVVNLWKCLIPAILAAATLILATCQRRWSRGPLTVLLCAYSAGVAWFFSAPDPRYASHIFILAMATGLAVLARKKKFILVAALLAIAPLVSDRNLWIPPPVTGLFYPTPAGSYTTITTSTGLRVNVPLVPPGGFEDRVWDAPLPSAPLSEVDVKEVSIPPLRLRHPPDLQGGFFRPTP